MRSMNGSMCQWTISSLTYQSLINENKIWWELNKCPHTAWHMFLLSTPPTSIWFSLVKTLHVYHGVTPGVDDWLGLYVLGFPSILDCRHQLVRSTRASTTSLSLTAWDFHLTNLENKNHTCGWNKYSLLEGEWGSIHLPVHKHRAHELHCTPILHEISTLVALDWRATHKHYIGLSFMQLISNRHTPGENPCRSSRMLQKSCKDRNLQGSCNARILVGS